MPGLTVDIMQLSLLLGWVVSVLRFGLALGVAVAPRKNEPVVAVGFNDDTIAKVEANLLQIATHR